MTTDEFFAEAERVGGFAFPASAATPDGGEYHCAGMTLRDWFAGQVLCGFVQRPSYTHADAETAAKFAYKYADAMLAERSK